MNPSRHRLVLRVVAVVLCTILITAPLAAGTQTQKRPLAHADCDLWRSVLGQQLSRDGKYLAYALVPEDGDGEVVVRNLQTGKEWRAPRGAQPTTVPQQNPFSEQPGPPPFAGRPQFTGDSKYVAFQILPTKAETAKARKEKKQENSLKNALGLIDVETGDFVRIERVKSFQVPEEGSGFIAYLHDSPTEENAKSGNADAAAARSEKSKKKEYGSELILRNLASKTERSFADAIDYSLTKEAKALVFAVSSRSDANGIFAVDTSSTAAPVSLLSGKGKFTKLAWDEKQTTLAFLGDRDGDAKQPSFKCYTWDRKSAAAREVASTSSKGFPSGWVISDKGSMTFSLDGSRAFIGTAPAAPPDKEEDSSSEEAAVADLWSWRDEYVQPMQKVRAEIDRNRTYRAVIGLSDGKFVQLADQTMPGLTPSRDGRWAIGTDDRPYRPMVGYDDESNVSDVYLVNTTDGSRKPIRKRQRFNVTLSPEAKYALFFDGKDWNTISTADGKVTNLTERIGVSFAVEDHDTPNAPPSYGNGGWTADDRYVLLYDRYDIWQVAPDGSAPRNLTAALGRKQQIEFRYARADAQEKFIDPSKALLLSAESEVTRDSGFYRVRINGDAPERLVMEPRHFTQPSKAKDADVYVLSASTFNQFPDLLVSDASFRDFRKVTDANPQKDGLLWGTSELVHYKNTDGVELSATLIKPENFDANKKYPMLVYIYEKLSQNVNHFVDPRPSHSINASYYASNGYLVLMPDIVYTIGYPGPSALKCVLPAIQAVVDKGFVDEKAIGIQGHSWGGYQIAYMITQTTRFRAASAGAPVANMTSAYSGIRWGTGLPRQFQYEHTQSRIGGSLWEKPMLFLENSAVFRADRIQTPLLMIHNDGDDAVPWYQGIEFFLALRRLGKEAYMFNYNGEPHGLRKRANQKDYTIRLQQFFDHFLKGAPEPEWMQKGIPYLEREKEKEKYRTTVDAREKAPTQN